MNDLTTTTDTSGFNALMDPARFKQMVDLSNVMAESSLIPDTLRYVDGDSKKALLPLETRQSNCFLIVEQSMRWQLSPFAVAQATSVVHGRMMFEGKLVAAVLQANLKIKFTFAYGKWDAAREECILAESGDAGTADALAIRVAEDLGNGQIGRYVDGHVGGWKTTGANTPWRASNFRKMLVYRGIREWARLHEPGPMLGVMTEDEIDFDNMRVVSPSEPTVSASSGDVMSRVKAAQSKTDEGFNNDRVQGNDDQILGQAGKATQEKPTGQQGGAKQKSAPKDLLGDVDQSGKAGDPNALSEKDRKWLLNSARMLLPMAKAQTSFDTIKAQFKAVKDEYPIDGISERAVAKRKSILDRTFDIAEGAIDEADGREIIAGIAGAEIAALSQQAEPL